ncbi:glutamate racemase [Desulfofustis glycolicus]|uniref:Glutamate racemase n=1 Tax=Desulfofustis glycolicus DSM 9705 TaxID=1121409 RepID=A0A1M5VAH3_9BACT|nr:aspartate/glutamate racemase family protein [Desulfofustis glycolicus]MCB2218214.1 aspartate/glutamate racemase family protein [Desulfobulbaceae bacterium]SHH72104.1 glutamate racemase [Desulfofustis glycolicus DSM 9705]
MIGVYDSGIGGLLLARKLGERYADRCVSVFCDTAASGLAARTLEQAAERCRSGLSYLTEQGARLIVIACHETVMDVLARPGKPSVPDLPLIDAVGVTARATQSVSTGGRIGIITSRTVVEGGIYEPLLQTSAGEKALFFQACPLLLPLIEEGWYNTVATRMIIKRYLRPLKELQIDTLIPACCSYQLVLPLIAARCGRRTRVVDPGGALIDAVAEQLVYDDTDGAHPGRPRYLVHVTQYHDGISRVLQTIFGRSTDRYEVL